MGSRKIANSQSLAILDRGLKSQPFSQFFWQDFYQTYARITGNQGFAQIFLGPFWPKTQENKQKISREALFLIRAKVGLRELW